MYRDKHQQKKVEEILDLKEIYESFTKTSSEFGKEVMADLEKAGNKMSEEITNSGNLFVKVLGQGIEKVTEILKDNNYEEVDKEFVG